MVLVSIAGRSISECWSKLEPYECEKRLKSYELVFLSSREIPEGFIVDSQVGVVSGVRVSPHVAHPHVKTGV